MDKVLDKISNLFKSKYCSRKNYWIFFGVSLLFLLLLLSLGTLIENVSSYGFYTDKYQDFLYLLFLVLNIIMQIKRLRDANMSPYFLFIYILFIFGIPAFNYIVYIVLLILLLLPTQRLSTTNIVKEKNKDE